MEKIERTLIFIKPDGVRRQLIGSIIERFEKKGLVPSYLMLRNLSKEEAELHYHEHKDKPFYNHLINYVTGGPVLLAVLNGKNAIHSVRSLCGHTDPQQSPPGTIRGDYGLSLDANIIHSSDSQESAEREIKNFNIITST